MRLGAVLASMAARRASGILTIVGDPAGIIYFDQGQITCARASWIPDIGARLLGQLGPSAGSPDLLAGADEPDRDIGTFLVQRNHLTVPELAGILRSVVVDAVIALTASAGEGAYISDIRFTSAGTHWAAAFSCQDVDSVLGEAARRAARMAYFGLGRGTPVRLHDLDRASAVLNRTQWTLACAIDRTASAQELAWRCGLALYDVIENVGELIAAGLCEPDEAAAPAPPGPLAEWFGPDAPAAVLPAAAWPPPSLAPAPPSVMAPLVSPAPEPAPSSPPPAEDRVPANLPRRARPASALPVPPVIATFSAADLGPMRIEMTPAAPDLLRRVLDGLKRS